ncbi:MAG: polysaccharide biosynthesis/export family protein, partial [Cyclobacteriaceae bacterium]|nr:polysaccharide biosynthesis/export family protein [Cyclobacteriaceae bacterium]
MARNSFLLIILLSWISGCVTNKQLTYLQYENDLKDINPTDTIMRQYSLKKKIYTLQPDDIISIRIASITDDEYNFIKKYETDLGLIRKLDQYSRNIEEAGQGSNYNSGRVNLGGGADGQISSIALDRQNTGFTLDANGELELPEIGVLKLSGLTIPEAEFKVKETLEGFYEVPMVRIQLLNYHFTVLGEVEGEGRYTSYDPKLTIFDAISLAGNIGEFADRSNIKIIRQEDEQAKVLYLNMLDETTLNADNFYVQRDDIIIVPALKVRTTTTYTLKNIS